jgi:hypothetical protein
MARAACLAPCPVVCEPKRNDLRGRMCCRETAGPVPGLQESRCDHVKGALARLNGAEREKVDVIQFIIGILARVLDALACEWLARRPVQQGDCKERAHTDQSQSPSNLKELRSWKHVA